MMRYEPRPARGQRMRSQGGANWPAALSWAVAHLRIRGATQGGLEPTSAAGLAVRQSRVSRAIRSRRRRSCAHALGGLDRRDRVVANALALSESAQRAKAIAREVHGFRAHCRCAERPALSTPRNRIQVSSLGAGRDSGGRRAGLPCRPQRSGAARQARRAGWCCHPGL
jgi:hypothetical protein